MSKLEQVQISGIRSFGIEAKHVQKIPLYSPLTLFLGQNGCGKTTIIESIKFALTGELPGNAKSGQGFVCDPNIHHVSRVLGQIRLSLTDVHGNIGHIVRIMKSEKGAGATLKFSTTDVSLKYTKSDGTVETLTGRINDLNNMVTQLIGVRSSILNNVLLCHQEQSLWPLDEGSALKKKFDDIFETGKFNNTVDSLRKIQKEKGDEIKLIKLRLSDKQKEKNEVETMKLRLQDRESRHSAKEVEIAQKREELVPIETRLLEISEIENKLLEIKTKKAEKEQVLKNLMGNEKSLKENVKDEFKGSDEDLQKEIDSFQEVRERDKKEEDRLVNEKQKLEVAFKENSELITKKNVIIVQTREELKQFNKKTVECVNLLRNVGKVLNCESVQAKCIDIDGSLQEIKLALDDKKADITKLKKELATDENKLQVEIDKFKEGYVQAEQMIALKERTIKELQTSLRENNNKLREINVSDEKLKTFEKSISSIDADLAKLQSSFDEQAMTEAIEKDKKRVRQLEEELDSLEMENRILQKNMLVKNDIENHEGTVVRRNADIDKLKSNNYEEFSLLFETLPTSNWKRAVEKLQSESNRKVNEVNNKINNLEKKITKQEVEYQYELKVIKADETLLAESKNKVKLLCGDVEYQEKCTELEGTKERLQKSKGQLSSAKVLYESFVDDMNVKKCCPVCSTNFVDNQSIRTQIILKLQNKVKRIPQELSGVEKELKKTEDLYKKVLQLKPVHEKIGELEDKLVGSRNKSSSLSQKLKEMETEMKLLKEQVKTPQKLLDTCGKIVSSAALIDEYNTNIEKSEKEIRLLQSQLKKTSSDKTQQEVEALIDNIKLDLTSLRESIEKNTKKLNNNTRRCQELRENRNRFVQQQLDLQKLMQGKPQIMECIKDCEEKVKNFRSDIEDLTDSLLVHKTDLEETKSSLEALKLENEAKVTNATSEYYKNENLFKEAVKIQESRKKMSEDEIQNRFDTALSEVTVLKTESASMEEDIGCVAKKIETIKIQLANKQNHFRILQDNKNLRETRRKQQYVQNEIEQLMKEIGDQNYDSISREKRKLANQRSQIDHDIQKGTGTKQELMIQIREIKNDLEKKKHVELEYRNMMVRLQVNEQALLDLKTYQGVLEKAISHFHKQRMLEINKCIKELWRQIYCGNDIDYIEIQNDIDQRGSRRSYQYKVMQKKNDAVLEMRGRCSAGQKVLACLIIRIALAEAFSANCGVLALDEPTTNLDRENIERLSFSLGRLIKSRESQKNFQLLIITHDEEFLRALRSSAPMRYYYNVSRDNSGCSVVTSRLL